jgi:hypothetical protein
MDDFNVTSLTESRNEYSMMFITKIAPVIIHGFESMFEDTMKLCIENDEEEKCLMAFQNFLARVPKWNQTIISNEVQRIKDETNCEYLEDLLTCVHVTHLKILTNVRVGQKQKKLELEVPQLDIFVHKVYIECARKLYKNVFLFEVDIMPIQKQKYKRDVDVIIRESIMDVIRNNMPIENILKAYLDETCEQDVYEEVEESFENIGETLPENTLQKDITEIKPISKQNNVQANTEVKQIEKEVVPATETPIEIQAVTKEASPKSQLQVIIPTELKTQTQPVVVHTEPVLSTQSIVHTQITASPTSKPKEVQFIGDFKENEPSGYNTSDTENTTYNSDADDETEFSVEGPKLKILDSKPISNALGNITDLSEPKKNDNITLEFEELK